MILKPTEKMICPHCRHQQEEVAMEYVVPGKVGFPSVSSAASECEECCREFHAMTLPSGNIQVFRQRPTE